MAKSPDAFRTISEVAGELDVPQHVLRFWESKFPQIKPMKRGGGRRYYRPDDVDLLRGIRHLLYGEGYTIKGVQRILREQGARHVMTNWRGAAEDGGEDPDLALKTGNGAALEENGPIPALSDDHGSQGEERVADLLEADYLGEDQLKQLKLVLHELEACRQLLDKAS